MPGKLLETTIVNTVKMAKDKTEKGNKKNKKAAKEVAQQEENGTGSGTEAQHTNGLPVTVPTIQKDKKKENKKKKVTEETNTIPQENGLADEATPKKKKKKSKQKESSEEDEITIPQENGITDKATPKKKKSKQKESSEDEDDTTKSDKKSKKNKKEKNLDKDKVTETPPKNAVTNEKKSLNEKVKQEVSPKKQINGKQTDSENELEKEMSPEEKAGAFSNFDISQATINKLKERKVSYLFPIQAKTFKPVYEGKDVIAQARTGTGKTLSFALPLVELLSKETNSGRGRSPKVLVMTPTRELAKQVSDDFQSISPKKLSVSCFYGGTPFGPQFSDIRNGIDVLVGTPGRLLDHLNKGMLRIDQLKHAVLDEVDRMLDMGFADTVDEILQFAYQQEQTPQTLLFSATCPGWVYKTADKYMKKDNIFKVDIIGQQKNKTSTTVQHLALRCSYHDRAATIGTIVQVYSGNHGRAIVFCEKKRDADELVASAHLKQESHVLHGDVPQQKREMVLKGFKDGTYKCLVATDVAARGLDIPEVDLVVQCNPPRDVDSYIHRSGRTGRAGRTGTCVLFFKPQEERDLRFVESKAGITFKRIGGPTTNDIIKASACDAARSLNDIPPATLQHFEESAEKLIAERGAISSLAAALAVISGCTQIVSRSLLSSNEGFTTYIFRTNIEMERISYAWRALERLINDEIKEKIMRMRFLADKKGTVFDLPSAYDATIKQVWQDTAYDTLEVAKELPELLESNEFSRDSYGQGRGRGRGFGGNRSFGRNQSQGFQRGGRGGFAFKRKFDGNNFTSNSPANKRTKFDD